MQHRRPDSRSEEAQAYRRWYKTTAWQVIRRQQLATEPLCRKCKTDGRITAASVCDHIEPHKGDRVKFFNGPFQSLCEHHHNGFKQQLERRGYSTEVGADGFPTDPNHPANRA